MKMELELADFLLENGTCKKAMVKVYGDQDIHEFPIYYYLEIDAVE